MLALMSDISSRSGSSCASCASSSSWLSSRCFSSAMSLPPDDLLQPATTRPTPLLGGALVDRGVLDGVGVGLRVVRQDVQGDGRVDRGGHVGVDQGHLLAIWKLLRLLLLQLLRRQFLLL